MKIVNEKYLTVRWNNILTVALAIPALIYIWIAPANLSETPAFWGLFVVGLFY